MRTLVLMKLGLHGYFALYLHNKHTLSSHTYSFVGQTFD